MNKNKTEFILSAFKYKHFPLWFIELIKRVIRFAG